MTVTQTAASRKAGQQSSSIPGNWVRSDQAWWAGSVPTTQQVSATTGHSPSIVAKAEANRGLTSNQIPTSAANIAAWVRGASGAAPNTYTNQKQLVAPRNTGAGSGGGGRGGGGGGGAAAPQYSQAQIDWLTQLLARSRPQATTATNLDLPDYNAQFDPSMYNELEGKFNTAVASDRAAANAAYGQLNQYLNDSYRNAFANNNYARQGPGQDSMAMQRMLQSQGMNPALAAQQTEGQAAGNAAFSNLWSLLGANEDTAQANRLRRAQIDAGTTNRALDVAALQGQTGIGLQRSQAQSAFQQRVAEMQNQIAQQEAMANWQRQNEVSDVNASNQNSYINAQMQALLGIMPDLKGSAVGMPSLDSLFGINGQAGGAPQYAPGGNAADPLGWAAIAQSLGNAGDPNYAQYRTV